MEQHQSKAGSIYLMGVGFFVALAGAVFMYFMWQSFSKAVATRSWEKTPAVMVESKMKSKSAEFISKDFRWVCEYTYEFEGESYTSKLRVLQDRGGGSKRSSSKKEVQELIDAMPVNKTVDCYVNPKNPTEAVLEHQTKAAGYSIWFPGIFVVGGLGMMVGAIRKMKPC